MKAKHIHIAYGLTALVLMLLSFFTGSTFDIQIHDTYIVIANWHIFILLAFLFGLYFIIAFLLYKKSRPMNKVLGAIHWLISIVGLITCAFLANSIINDKPTRYFDYSIYESDNTYSHSLDLNYMFGVVILILLITQLLYFTNFVLALIKPK